MKKCGVILLDTDNNSYLLVHGKKSGKWGFPKGHMEIGETEEMTAHRELYEETGIHLPHALFKKRIRFRNNIYFLISLSNEEIPKPSIPIPDNIEIAQKKWFFESELLLLDPNICNFGLKHWINTQHNKKETFHNNSCPSLPVIFQSDDNI